MQDPTVPSGPRRQGHGDMTRLRLLDRLTARGDMGSHRCSGRARHHVLLLDALLEVLNVEGI